MLPTEFSLPAATVLVLAQCTGASLLEKLNRDQAQMSRDTVPDAFRDTVTPETQRKTVDYTIAKSRFSTFSGILDSAVLVALLWSGLLPLSWKWAGELAGQGVWSQSAWLFAVGMALSLPSLPLEWWGQFRLEERFGFNTTTLGTWILDRLKGLLLASVLGLPLLTLILKLVDWMGTSWWAWASICPRWRRAARSRAESPSHFITPKSPCS